MGRFYPRQTVLTPLGLITQPNQYDVYKPGALKIAQNCVMRNPGELMQAPDVQNTVTLTGNDFRIHKLFALDAGHVVAIVSNGTGLNSVVYADTSAYTLQGFNTGALDEYSITGRVSLVRLRERLMINTLNGYVVADSMSPTAAPDRVLRRAGMPQPNARYQSSGPDGPIPQNTVVGYRFCWRRNFSDGYFIRSVPTPVLTFVATAAGTTVAQYLIDFLNSGEFLVGDIVEMYRTDGLTTPATTAGLYKDPGSTCKLVLSYAITSGDIATGSKIISDYQPFVQGTLKTPGEELYTNPYQETETFSNRQPPIAACTAAFKGYCFFANTTDRPAFEFTVPGGIGDQNIAVTLGYAVAAFKASAIGARRFTGTRTNGSPTLTGVSAADLVGIVVGQSYDAFFSGFPGGTTVQSINTGAGTITMSQNATSSSGGAVTMGVVDVLELDGQRITMYDLGTFSTVLGFSFWVEQTCDSPLATFTQSYIVGASFVIEPARLDTSTPGTGTTITVRGTNGALYSPPIPDITASVKTFTRTTRKNHLVWSKFQQPEHVPTVLEDDVGNGEIIALDPTRDALGIWCTDGFYRLSGDGGADGLAFRVDLVTTTVILAAPQASCVLNEVWFGYTNQGLVSIDSAGNIDNISDRLFGDLLPGAKYSATRSIIMCANEPDDEILLGLGEDANGNSDTIYVYNTKQKGLTTLGANGATLSNIQAMAMQRDPASGAPRALFGVYRAGTTPQYSGWNSPSAFLNAAIQYQPLYDRDPLSLKNWIWADYLFAPTDAGRLINPSFNGANFLGTISVQALDTGAYARAGVPRQHATAHAIAPGIAGIPNNGVQCRFQGLSMLMRPRTSQSKKR